mmetsp:Transcript_6242/g.10195  ORF Transcript_6242/g.10195 Transcript_6242/m.10195 type:complete len:342 (-) Transcript_6242:131-1156(-)
MRTATLGKSKDMGRTGTHGTIYKVKRDPKLDRDDYIKDKTSTDFGFVGGSSYKGAWENNKKHGFGVETTADGTKYEGEWVHDMREGRGTQWVKRNKKFVKQYAGNWVGDKMDGDGVFNYEDGSVYKGSFSNNKRHHYGKLEFENGDIYTGEWSNDVRSGSGTLSLQNGNIYEGHWLNNMKEGPGKFFYASTNKVYEGEWVEDSPKCGEFREPSPEEQKCFGRSAMRTSKFTLPECKLENIRSVLDTSVAATRNERAQFRGMSHGETFSSELLQQAETLFENINIANSGEIAFQDSLQVLEVLGVEFSEEEQAELMQQLEISGASMISFPEVVDIAAFILGN